VTIKNAVFWDVTPCGYSKDRPSEERSTSIIRVTRIGKLETTLADVVPSSATLLVSSDMW
jgi:hypothetical protein